MESWHSNGKRFQYGRFEKGREHGTRFEWDLGGKLVTITVFNRGEITEEVSENLEKHPEYKTAQKLTAKDR
jgi:hypothetical protein